MRYYVRFARYTLEKSIPEGLLGEFGFIIPANLLLYYNKSLSKYLKNMSKPFFIDPMTYLFRYPLNMAKSETGEIEHDADGKNKIKKSYENLINIIDPSLMNLFKNGQSIPIDYFSNEVKFNNFIEKNIFYQNNMLNQSQDKLNKYDELIGLSPSESSLVPEFITAPYFYADGIDEWYALNKRMTIKTKEQCNNQQVYSIICVNKDMLFNNDLAPIISRDFSDSDGFILYFSNLDLEQDAFPLIQRLIKFISTLKTLTQKPIINLYSSALSLYLNYFGLDAFSSGLCILEKRNATADSGFAVARIKFYIPSSHEKITEENFKTYLRTFNPVEECDCNFCTHISSSKTQLSEQQYFAILDGLFTKKRGELMNSSMKHFLLNRINEVSYINQTPLEEVILNLRSKATYAEKYRITLPITNNSSKIIRLLQ